MSGRVFVVQEVLRRDADGELRPAHDLTPAAAHGELELLLSWRTSVMSPAPMVHELRRKLRGFCNEDSILAVGDPVAIGAAVAVAVMENAGKAAVLKWNRETRSYIKVRLDLFPRPGAE